MLSDKSCHIAIYASTACQYAKAKQLAATLDLPLVEQEQAEFELLLIVSPSGIAIQSKAIAKEPLYIDFLAGKNAWRQQSAGPELLAKAIGYKSHYKPWVLDLSAGLGRDAFVLANLGCRVDMLERSPIMAVLLEDGLERLAARRSTLQLRLFQQDAMSYLAQIPTKPDVIYFDPMYPHRNKSALVKKEMRIVRALVGDDVDAAQVCQRALLAAGKRLVVKRPRLAPELWVKPDIVFTGKTSRFDVYLVSSQ
jgi:16S rRNA (guanine1516-N2)-methyltransferase